MNFCKKNRSRLLQQTIIASEGHCLTSINLILGWVVMEGQLSHQPEHNLNTCWFQLWLSISLVTVDCLKNCQDKKFGWQPQLLWIWKLCDLEIFDITSFPTFAGKACNVWILFPRIVGGQNFKPKKFQIQHNCRIMWWSFTVGWWSKPCPVCNCQPMSDSCQQWACPNLSPFADGQSRASLLGKRPHLQLVCI